VKVKWWRQNGPSFILYTNNSSFKESSYFVAVASAYKKMWPNYKTDTDMVGRNTEQVAGGCRKLNHKLHYIPIFLTNKKNEMGCARSKYRPDDKRVKESGKSERKQLLGRHMIDSRKIP
jgi:hypothetical protein